MAIYLEKFILPIDKEERLVTQRMMYNGGPALGYIDNIYPCGLFSEKGLRELDFNRITILYGGNGSGKSTLLNLISNKLELKRIAPYNSSELFDSYVNQCQYRLGYNDNGLEYKKIPIQSRMITSDDIFDYMLTVRENNNKIADDTEELHDNGWAELKFGQTIKMKSIEDYDNIKMQVMARKRSLSRRKFIYNVAGREVKLNSNGETALDYFDSKLKEDCLYCLDEPENSLSPKFQQQLVKVIEKKAKYCGCQFVIATHSPFVLALPGAKIYDLDSMPVDLKKWWELENTKEYYKFFMANKNLFEGL